MADFYHKFLELEQEEQDWLALGMDKGTRATIKMVQLITEKSLTYEEIAEETGQHPNTVIQKLNALSRGGFPLNLTNTTAIAETGRPRKLARRLNKDDLVKSVEKLLITKKK